MELARTWRAIWPMTTGEALPLPVKMEIPPPPAHKQVTGWKRRLFVTIGLGFVGVAYIGAMTPGLPTAIWVIIASYFFGRSSPRLQAWLWYSPMFGPLIRDWQLHGGMRPRSKIIAVSCMSISCTCSILFANLPDWVRIVIGCCGMIGFTTVVFIVPTVRLPTVADQTPR
jgi:uncharacterized protein